MDGAVDPDPEISLFLKEGEKIGRGAGFGHRLPLFRLRPGGDRKGDEETPSLQRGEEEGGD
jgi:hypothetical protein